MVGSGRVSTLEPSFAALEVRAGELVVEEELDVGQLLELIQKSFVETCSVHSPNELLSLV